jgi:carboxymethylenebutenolidase
MKREHPLFMPSFKSWKLLCIVGVACGYAAIASVPRDAIAAPMPKAASPQASGGQTVQFTAGDTSISAYLAKPKDGNKHPAVIVVHDVGGVDQAVQDVARRLADAGFVVFVPNLLSRAANAKTPQQAFAALGQMPLLQPVSDLKAGLAFLQKDANVDASKISVIGFGWGGWRAYKLAEDSTGLYRTVIFYGATPADDTSLTRIQTPILAHYAQYDFRDTGNALWTEKQLGSKFKFYVYLGTDRGFFMPDATAPYGFPGLGPEESANAEAAKLAWTRTLEFLKS